MVLWIVLIAVFVLVKENRNPRALLILVPLLMVNLLWLGLARLLGAGSAQREMFGMLFQSVVVGVAVLWLLAHKLGNRNRFVTFVLALAVMTVPGLLRAISHWGLTAFSEETAGWLIILTAMTVTMLVAFVLSGWRCRKRYGSVRFMLWLVVWTVAVCIVTMLVIMTVVFAHGRPGISILKMLSQVCIIGLIFGLCVYVINFPYMILAFRSSFFRERFYACLRLKSMPATNEPRTDTDHLGGPAPETCENGDSE